MKTDDLIATELPMPAAPEPTLSISISQTEDGKVHELAQNGTVDARRILCLI